MAIANRDDLLATLADWLERGDINGQIEDFVGLTEALLNKVLRDPQMVETVDLSLTTPFRSVALPADFLDVAYVEIEGYPLEQVSPDELTDHRRRMRNAGPPRFYCLIGRSLAVCPSPAANTTVELAYYAKIPALTVSNPTNWLLTADPDVYLYTALLHAAVMLGDEARMTAMSALVTQEVTMAVQAGQTVTLADTRQPNKSSIKNPGELS